MSDEPRPTGNSEAGPAEDGASETASLLAAAPALARIALSAWWRTAEWTAGTSVRTGSRVVRAAMSGESAAEMLQQAGADVREYARQLLGLAESMEAAAHGETPPAGHDASADAARANGGVSLRERGAELLRRSADVHDVDRSHPAYDRILDDLAPDEARVLRFLCLEGPQPAVDVRATRVPVVSSELVAPGLSMIGSQSGCRHLGRVPAYLNNLYRLGLIWFSRESLGDPLRYQVLEAQPDVIEALGQAGRVGRTVRRSIHLTPFGEDFCASCLPLGREETYSGPAP